MICLIVLEFGVTLQPPQDPPLQHGEHHWAALNVQHCPREKSERKIPIGSSEL